MVKSGTIIQRMLEELGQAKRNQDRVGQMKKHIENVQLLCEVILADGQSSEVSSHVSVAVPQSHQDITEQEMKAMMIGQQTQSKHLGKQSNGTDDDDEDSGSLFDF